MAFNSEMLRCSLFAALLLSALPLLNASEAIVETLQPRLMVWKRFADPYLVLGRKTKVDVIVYNTGEKYAHESSLFQLSFIHMFRIFLLITRT